MLEGTVRERAQGRETPGNSSTLAPHRVVWMTVLTLCVVLQSYFLPELMKFQTSQVF